jgi:hypothetical protein
MVIYISSEIPTSHGGILNATMKSSGRANFENDPKFTTWLDQNCLWSHLKY